jgi:hypothetical protein
VLSFHGTQLVAAMLCDTSPVINHNYQLPDSPASLSSAAGVVTQPADTSNAGRLQNGAGEWPGGTQVQGHL